MLVPEVEELSVYDLIKEFSKGIKNMNGEEVVIYFDSRKVLNRSKGKIQKEIQCTQEASTEIKGMKKEMK